MNLSWTMQRYIAVQLFVGIMSVFGGCAVLTLMIDLVEMLNRAAGKEGVGFFTVMGMSFLKLPSISEKILPFAVLFGSMWTFTRLTRTQELVVVRASGMSVWQFLAPALVLAALLGVLSVAVYNPVAAAMMGRFEDLEARYIKGKPSLLSLQSTGLWLRQADEGGQSVIHALSVRSEGRQLDDVIIFLQDKAEKFVGRIDAKSAKLYDGEWALEEAWRTGTDRTPVYHARMSLPTPLTPEQIQDSFTSPETISFWDLPNFIRTFEDAGLKAVRHRLHYSSLLASPFLFCAMTIIAASFSLRLARLGGVTRLILAGSLTGFLLYFLSDVTQALGISGILPVTLAAWSPTAVALLLGAATLLHLEDG
jgi:lipopolysaccharide export system permease protein